MGSLVGGHFLYVFIQGMYDKSSGSKTAGPSGERLLALLIKEMSRRVRLWHRSCDMPGMDMRPAQPELDDESSAIDACENVRGRPSWGWFAVCAVILYLMWTL